MDENLIFDMTRQALWVAVTMSAPLLIVALVTGVAIGLFQALTSVQEMTLTFVPKLIAVAVILLFFGNWMMHESVTFAENIITNIPRYLQR